MNAALAEYRRKTGFLNGMVAWFKCVAIGALIIGALAVAFVVVAALMNGIPERIIAVLTMPKFWGYIIGIPLGLLIYYLPYFIETRVSRTSDGMTLGLIMNTLLGWFPVFWFIMLMLAIFKNR